jgi:hypothetical protein
VVGGPGRVTGTAGEPVGVLGDEDGGAMLAGDLDGERLGPSEAGTTVALVGGERLVGELVDDLPALALGERTTVLELRGDRAVRVLGALGAPR